METLLEDCLPRTVPRPTDVENPFLVLESPPVHFKPITYVPEVSLLDPNEIVRPPGEDKISYKLWRKHKAPIAPPTVTSDGGIPTVLPVQPPPPPAQPSNERINELMAIIDRQQAQIEQLQQDNVSIRMEMQEMSQHFQALVARVDGLSQAAVVALTIPPPVAATHHQPAVLSNASMSNGSSRWQATSTPVEEPSPRRPNTDKSQMMNNLFRKYFPDNPGPGPNESISPSNVPIFEYGETEKSTATYNYLAKYQLIGANGPNEPVLDISKLKRQTKL